MKWHHWVACNPHLTVTFAEICTFSKVYTAQIYYFFSSIWGACLANCAQAQSSFYFGRMSVVFVFITCLRVLSFFVLFCSGWPRPSWTCWSSWPPGSPWTTRPPWKHRKRWTPWPHWRTSKGFVFVMHALHVSFICPHYQPVLEVRAPSRGPTRV